MHPTLFQFSVNSRSQQRLHKDIPHPLPLNDQYYTLVRRFTFSIESNSA